VSRHRRQRHRRQRRDAELTREAEVLRAELLLICERHRERSAAAQGAIATADALFSIFGFRRVEAEG